MIKEEKHDRSYIYQLCKSKPVSPSGDAGFSIRASSEMCGRSIRDGDVHQRLALGDVIELKGQKMVILSMPKMTTEQAVNNPFTIKAGVVTAKSLVTGSVPIKMLEAKVVQFDPSAGTAVVDLAEIE